MHHDRSIALVLAGVVAAAAVAMPSANAADPETYSLDPVHTRVVFAVSHAGFSSALGTVSGSTGTLLFDRDDWCSARLDVSVPMAGIDLGDPRWNAATLATNLLDVARFPEARFVSDTVEPAGADRAKVCGHLTLRGVSQPLCMDVVLNALKRHPLPPFRRTAGFSATATLNRSDYGITAWKSVIGDAVELRIEAEAVRGPARASIDDLERATEPSVAEPASTPAPAATDEPPESPDATPAEPVVDPVP